MKIQNVFKVLNIECIIYFGKNYQWFLYFESGRYPRYELLSLIIYFYYLN